MPTETNQETQYLTRAEAAKIIGVDVRTIDYWIRKGELKRFKSGTSKSSIVRILKTDFNAFLRSRGKV